MIRANQIAYEYIRSRIIDGTFRPAQRLVEAQLAQDIGVSRNTVKKVLLQIEQERLITIEDNKGARVLSLSIEEIQEYYEIRRSLEVLVVRAAVRRITDEELMRMRQILVEMVELKKNQDYDNYSKGNRRFHDIIYDASGKTVAVEMIKGIKMQLIRFQFRTMLAPGRSDNSVLEHQALLDALANRDEEAATLAITRHIDNVVDTIVKYKALFY
ncbi:MAG: GntR family transcriptional regulator [Candidatus Cloacimonetes bacterium]|uniref:GntR family transcriptional regulator n=1 Tax=Sphaerochaeta associata TaxID=1129264 RepID=UPI000A3FA4CC|nr:GntR family transcriptional regulator [Sphaerochaeta associata]MDD3523629.1 GntR family transcriptional regulator [Candidatus Cloacimonadota bacterium]MEA5028963.1 GntR family transcriptional regulator [Sphaerochaeta associata]